MRITGCEILHCNAGWRDFSFLKLTTDENIIGIISQMEVRVSYVMDMKVVVLVKLYHV